MIIILLIFPLPTLKKKEEKMMYINGSTSKVNFNKSYFALRRIGMERLFRACKNTSDFKQ